MSPEAAGRGPGRGKKILFAALAVAIVLGAAELILWGAGMETLLAERDPFRGFSSSMRVFEPVDGRDVLATPPRVTRHSFNHQEFLAEKPAPGFRLFTLGGSSAYGFPWGAGVAFTRPLGDALRDAYPDVEVEAVNAAAMSYGSHRLRILAEEIAGYAPDAVLVYGGHNEFVETRFYADLIERSPALDPLRRVLHRSRLYAVLTRAIESEPAPDAETERDVGELLGVDVARETRAVRDDEERRRIRGFFEENLRAIVAAARRANARVVLCTVASNVRDWRPNRSLFAETTGEEARGQVLARLEEARRRLDVSDAAGALAALEPARELAPGYADTEFLLGRAFEASERWAEARRAYARARDADGDPARALGMLNETIRTVAASESTLLLDVERLFEESSPHGLVGFNLIEDYVHPNQAGHRLIAGGLYRMFLEEGLVGEPREPDDAAFLRAAGTWSDGAASGRTPAALFNLAIVLENQGHLERAKATYRECLTLDPRYYAARCNLALILLEEGRPAEAEREARAALALAPGHVRSLVALGTALSALGRPAEAETSFRSATTEDPRWAPAWNGLGLSLAQQRRMDEAEAAFRRSVAIDPDDAGAQGNLGHALLFQGRAAEAVEPMRRALALAHDNLRARNGLADALAATGATEEAARLYREVLAASPEDPRALQGLARLEGRPGGGP